MHILSTVLLEGEGHIRELAETHRGDLDQTLSAFQGGLDILVYDVQIDLESIDLNHSLPYEL